MKASPLGVLRLSALSALVASCAGAAPRSSTPPPSMAPVGSTADAGAAAEEAVDAAAEGAAPPATGEVSADAGGGPASAEGSADASAPSETSALNSDCNDQAPQDFLVRGNFLKGGEEAMRRAIQYRTDTYGYFKGFGRAPANPQPPSSFVVTTTFMNLPVRMHRKVVPALRCAEVEIRRTCADHPYTAQALAGIRFRNTYRGGEVTNHIFGIAIVIDPARNTCCGCVPPWNDAPRCKRPAKTEYERMEMPECWVHAFERFGFYWLGHDRLRDTMHFEFLGDPDRIVRSPTAP